MVALTKEIINRGSNVQAGRVLSELTLAYEYAIGLEQFPSNFANPALLAKMSIKQSRLKVTCKKGTRVLNDQELKHVWAWLPTSGFTTHQKHILFLTSCGVACVCVGVGIFKEFEMVKTMKDSFQVWVILPI